MMFGCTQDILRQRDHLDTGRMIDGVPCGLIGMVTKDLELQPKIDAMMRDFLNSSRWEKLSKEMGSKILLCGYGSRGSIIIILKGNSKAGFPAQSVGSSNTDVLDSPCLLVLITGTSQSRQHVITSLIHIESCKSPTVELFDVDSGRISIRHWLTTSVIHGLCPNEIYNWISSGSRLDLLFARLIEEFGFALHRGTDKSEITRKQSKTSKHEHENQKSSKRSQRNQDGQ
ncbi:hypothetical protein Tco_0286340 [Tanacetum coccineum]